MSVFLTLAFLFFIGSVFGWVLELFFRRFFSSSNPERKWINPGFCVGPYVPLYGFGLCFLYIIASMEKYSIVADPVWEKALLFAFMAFVMTAIEYIAGIMCLKLMNVRLWDYSGMWGNVQGLICPLFSFFWAVLGAVYYFLVHPHILDALRWLSDNLAFSFVVGMFFGVFIIDVCYSAKVVVKIREYARENDVVVRFEFFKSYLRVVSERTKEKYSFLFPFRVGGAIGEHLREYHEHMNALREKFEQSAPRLGRKGGGA